MMTNGGADLNAQALSSFFKKEPNVLLAYIFGSSCPKSQHTGFKHDIDIALLIDPETIKNKGWLPLKIQLREGICKNIGRDDVDLVFLNSLPLHFKHEVLSGGMLIYEKSEELRINFETKQILDYLDWEPYAKIFQESVRNYFLNHP